MKLYALATALSLTFTPATASVLDFEDIGSFILRNSLPALSLSSSYQGASWPSESGRHWGVVENSDSQFQNARSGTQALWNWNNGDIRNIVFDILTDVSGAYFSVFSPGASWSAKTVQLRGYDEAGALIGSSSVVNLNNSSSANVWSYVEANLADVKRLEVVSTGGWWAMDDLEINAIPSVPVPASGVLMFAALGGLAAYGRKRRF